jgi:hypothetical protein
MVDREPADVLTRLLRPSRFRPSIAVVLVAEGAFEPRALGPACPVDSAVLERWWRHRRLEDGRLTVPADPGLPAHATGLIRHATDGAIEARRWLRLPLFDERPDRLLVADLFGITCLAARFARAAFAAESYRLAVRIDAETDGDAVVVDAARYFDGRRDVLSRLRFERSVGGQVLDGASPLCAPLARALYEGLGRLDCELLDGDDLAAPVREAVESRWAA